MKKSAIIFAAALLCLCMTGCGDSADGASSVAETTTDTSDTTTDTTSDTTDTTTDTTSDTTDTTADTSASTTDKTSTTAAGTTTAATTAAASDSKFSVDDLVGEWTMPGTFGGENNTMTVRKDGKYIVRYAAGGTRTGQVKIEKDASGADVYQLFSDDGTAWINYPCGNLPVNEVSTTQESGLNFVRYSMEDVAANKMEAMNFMWMCTSGAGSLSIDAEQVMEADGGAYSLIQDTRFSVNTKGKAAMEKLLEETACGTVRENMQSGLNACFREQNGAHYVQTSNAKGMYNFITDKGVKITDETDTSFTATCNMSDMVNGTGSAKFTWDGTNWVIESFEFK